MKRRRRMMESESSEEDESQPGHRHVDSLDVAAVAEQLASVQVQGNGRQEDGAVMLPVAKLLGLLEQLDEFPMTLAVLRESGVAKAVKPLRGHVDSRVASAAGELFARWKREAKSIGGAATVAAATAAVTVPAASAAAATLPPHAVHTICQPAVTPAAALRALLSGRAASAATRQAAQESVCTSMLAKFRGRANFTELTKEHVSCAFALIDKELLGGQLAPLLKQERRTISFRVAPRMTARAGQLLTEHAKPREHELAISSTLLMQTFQRGSREVVVNGCHCANRTEALLRVVEHEMIHLLFICDGMPAHCRTQSYHGPAFCNAVKKLFGHKDYRHDLVTPREVAASSGLEAGCTVRFTMSGETLTGKVNRVTKRATVLVKCDAGHRDAREFSDGQHYRKFFVPVEDCRVLSLG
jgi:hypothetical protein